MKTLIAISKSLQEAWTAPDDLPRLSVKELGTLCSCATERFIEGAVDPRRMRAEFLCYVFIEQLVRRRYGRRYEDFKLLCPGVTIEPHSGEGGISPALFTWWGNKRHLKTDWPMTVAMLRDCLLELEAWLGEDPRRLRNSAEEKIWDDFGTQPDRSRRRRTQVEILLEALPC